MFIDTHAHLNFAAFDTDRDQVIKDCFQNGVEKIINVGAKLDSSQSAVELAQKYDGLYASVGIHPHHSDQGLRVQPLKELERLTKNPKVVAIGETGLDFHKYVAVAKPGIQPKNQQIKVFLAQVDLAKKLDLPLIIHSRDSIEELLPLVVQLKTRAFPEMKAVFHCWTYELEWAKKILDLGFSLSFTPIITYPKNGFLAEVIKYAPLEQLLLETDSPYLPPQQNRGLRNTPLAVKIVGQSIAEIKDITLDVVENTTTINAVKLFGFGELGIRNHGETS